MCRSDPRRLALVLVVVAGCTTGVNLGGDGEDRLEPADDAGEARDEAAEIGPEDAGPEDAGPEDAGPEDAPRDEAATTGDCEAIAADIVVPRDFDSIQAAIDAARDGQVVCVEPGIYVENVLFSLRAIRVVGAAGAEGTILTPAVEGPVVTFASGNGPETVFEGFTVRAGYGSFGGGGIAVSLSSPTLRRLVVRDSYADIGGGGLHFDASSSVIEDVDVIGNGAGSEGGGIYASGGSLTLTDVRITGNHAGSSAGGLYLDGVAATLTRVEISNNMSRHSTGGVLLRGSSARLTDVRIADNEAEHNDGGIRIEGRSSPALERVAIVGNRAGYEGGGLSVEREASATLRNGVIAGNHADYAGGGVHVYGGSITFDNVRITGNDAGRGGGLSLDGAGGILHNVIVAGNRAGGRGAGLHVSSGTPELSFVAIVGNSIDAGTEGRGGGMCLETGARPRLTGVVVAGNRGRGGAVTAESAWPSFAHCAFWDNGPEPFVEIASPVGVDGNIEADPAFLDTTAADPDEWDLHLGGSSALVDAGGAEAADPDGSPSDIGAYGGPGAGGWDLDGDGSPEWWQPGPYDSGAHPAAGWDCDDRDPAVGPLSGC